MEQKIKKQFIAARAVIIKDGKILIIREGNSYGGGTNHGKYDFPGGKVEVGESIINALKRETQEEVGMDINVGKPFFVDEWKPIIKGEQIQIIGVFFVCEPLSKEVKPSSSYDDYKWINTKDYLLFPLIESTEHALKEFYTII